MPISASGHLTEGSLKLAGHCYIEAHSQKQHIIHPKQLQPVRNKSECIISAPIHLGIIKGNQKINLW